MSATFRTTAICLLVLSIAIPWGSVHTDVGPKPTMEFQFKQGSGDPQLTIVSGTLFECDQSDCSDATPLEQLGPQGFTCDQTSCSALAYGFSDYHRLEITFSDGVTRSSNIFKTSGFNSFYTVTVQQSDLLVESKLVLLPNVQLNQKANLYVILFFVLICGACIVGIAIIVVVIVLLVRKNKKKQ